MYIYIINQRKPERPQVDQETQVYYDNYFSLFMTDGWKQLTSEFTNNATNINSIESAKDINARFVIIGEGKERKNLA